jgi:hypothetical protein
MASRIRLLRFPDIGRVSVPPINIPISVDIPDVGLITFDFVRN